MESPLSGRLLYNNKSPRTYSSPGMSHTGRTSAHAVGVNITVTVDRANSRLWGGVEGASIGVRQAPRG